MTDGTVNIKVETEGLDEATEKVESIADAINGFPPQVAFKYLRNCTINVYPSQTKFVEVKEANHQQEYENRQHDK